MIDPSKTSGAYDQMAQKWALPHALMGGTRALQAKGQQYLPQHPAENPIVYRERAKRTVLRNYFRQTVHKLVGRVFSDPIAPSDDMPSLVQNYLKNMDLTGRGLNNFAQSWFEDALVSGISYILVDYPAKNQAALPENDRRPYAVHIRSDQLIAAQTETVGAAQRLSQIRIVENLTDFNGFEEEEIQQIRVLTPSSWETYRQNAKGHWYFHDGGENSLGEIPLVPLYTRQTGFLQASPPLEDLAYLNLEHYQIRSDQRNALNVASFPILAASGYDPEIDGPIEVGPNKVLTTSDTEGRYYYVESSGAALQAGARELADLEKAIQLFGLQFEAGSVAQTATGRSLDAADAVTPLGAMIMNLEDSLNQMLGLFGKWMDLSDVGNLTVQADVTAATGQNTEISTLLALHQAGVVSIDDLLSEIKSRGIVSQSLAFNSAA